MALLTCSGCGRSLSDLVNVCTGCGRPTTSTLRDRVIAAPFPVAQPRKAVDLAEAARRYAAPLVLGGCASIAFIIVCVALNARAKASQEQRDESAASALASANAETSRRNDKIRADKARAEAEKNLCDLSGTWSRDVPPGYESEEERATHRAKHLAELRSWTPACRMKAVQSDCANGCGDVFTGPALAAATDETERRALRKARLDLNLAALARTQAIVAQVKAIVDYAERSRGLPRSSAYRSGTDVESMAADLANGNPCRDRQLKDFARIEDLRSEVRTVAPACLDGTDLLDIPLVDAKSCLDCSDDRRQCTEMHEDLSRFDEPLKDAEETIAKDRKALANQTTVTP